MSSALQSWQSGMFEIGDGVFAYIQPNGQHGNAGWSNAGLIVGDEYCAVVDTLGTSAMHDGFIAAIRKVTSKPVSRVLLTHHHVDHVLGTARFLPACVIAHRACRQNMAANTDGAVARWAAKRPHFAPDLQGVRMVLPDLTFEDRVTLHVGKHEVVFFHPGVAHTNGDAAAHLPASRILFAGDLFFNRVCPAAFAGSLQGWIAAVDGMLALDVTTFVPGHGPLSGKVELARMRDYLRLIQKHAALGFAGGASVQEVARTMPLGDLREWADTEERLVEDVERAYSDLAAEASMGGGAGVTM